MKMGESFAAGDCMYICETRKIRSANERTVLAYTQLQALKIQILEQIIVNLRSDNIDLNYAGLQQCAESSQTQAIDCLGMLRQRLLQAAPIQALPYHQRTGFVTETGAISDLVSRTSVETTGSAQSQRRQSNASSNSPFAAPSPYDGTDIDHNPWENEAAGPSRTRTQRGSFRNSITNAISRTNTVTSSPPMNIENSGGSRTSSGTLPVCASRSPIETSTTTPLSPLSMPTSLPASPPVNRSSFSLPFRRRSSQIPIQSPRPPSSTSRTTTENTVTTLSQTAKSPQISTAAFSSTSQLAMLGFYQPRSVSEDALPSYSNSFLGLCKSAYRMQVGRTKDALQIGTRTISAFTYQKYLVCSKGGCHFEGTLEGDKPDKTAVNRKIVRGVDNKIYFRWSFMFKCHLPAQDSQDKKFGCIFCCYSASSAGNKLPILFGEKQYLGHILDVHMGEGRWPDENVLHRVGAIVSSTWPDHKNWDLLLVDGPDHSAIEPGAAVESLDPLSRQVSAASEVDSGVVEIASPPIPELDREETFRSELAGTAVLTPTSSSSSIPPVLPSIGYSSRHTANSSSGTSLIEEAVEEEDSDWPLQYTFSEDASKTESPVMNSITTIRRAPSAATDISSHHAFLASAIAGPSIAAALTQSVSPDSIEFADLHNNEKPQVNPIIPRTTAYLSLQ